MKAAVIVEGAGLLQNKAAAFLGRQHHVEVAVLRGGGVGEYILVDPLDGVADLCRHFRRRDNEIFHRNLNGRRQRRDGGARHKSRDDREHPSRPHGVASYFNIAATCSACCSWPWKIFSPVCSRLFSSALLEEGMSCVSSALSTALW